jgi:phage baseplate assembly protein V
MSAEIGDLQRRLANILRVGKIVAVNRDAARCKVSFQGVTTPWLPWSAGRAGSVRDWCPPSIGEQVCVISPAGDMGAGFVLAGGIYTSTNSSPDNRENVHRLDIPSGGAFEINVGGAKILTENGKAQIIVGGATFEISGGKMKFSGDLEVAGDIKAGSVSLKNHVHPGVTPGPSSTAQPAQ